MSNWQLCEKRDSGTSVGFFHPVGQRSQVMPDIEDQNPDPPYKVQEKRTRKSVNEATHEMTRAKEEKAKANLFKFVRQLDTEKASRDLEDLLRPMTKEDKENLCRKTDDEGNTAFHLAAKAGNLEACNKLLKSNGASLNAKNNNNMTPIQFAARYGDRSKQDGESGVWKCMKLVIDTNKEMATNPRSPKKSSRMSLMGSTKSKREKDDNYDWKEKDRYGFNLLHLAIQNINWADETIVVNKLLGTGAFEVTDTDDRGNNCLHLAAQLEGEDENRALCAFLKMKDLKNCLQAENIEGETPLACATKAGNVDSVKRLLGLDSFDLQHPLRIAARYLIH